MLTLSPRVAAAAGEEFTDVRISWELIDVVVPPGPLGILLDSKQPNAAVLEGFAPIDRHGAKGAVELHGGVLPGSILVRVNHYDLTEGDMSFVEIGHVLRETAHLERALQFKVPVPVAKSATPPPKSVATPPEADEWTDDAALAQELALVSPASIALSDSEPFEQPMSKPTVAPLSPLASPVEGAYDELPPSVPITAPTSGTSGTDPAAPASAPAGTKKAWSFRGFTLPSMPKSLPKSLPKSMPALPTLAALKANAPANITTMLFDDVSATSASTATAPDQFVTVDAPPGPLGLNLDGAVLDHAVVVGFAPLPDGAIGALEAHGGILKGSVLIKINDDDVSTWTLDAIRTKLSDLRDAPARTLTFRLPRVAAVKPKTPRAAPVPLVEDLVRRRKLELALVVKYDKTVIDRHECWFVVDALWMTAWVNFAARSGPLPGPIANEHLLEPQWEARLDGSEIGRPEAPRDGLELTKHYRCVTPMVWCLFLELHGATRAPLLPRFVLDIYAEPVSDGDVAAILKATHPKATILANELRDKCTTQS